MERYGAVLSRNGNSPVQIYGVWLPGYWLDMDCLDPPHAEALLINSSLFVYST